MMVIDQTQIKTRRETISDWYTDVFPIVSAYINRRGGNLEDAKEIFQEAIIVFYEKCANSDFIAEQSDEAYLVGIAKKRWLKHCANKQQFEDIESVDFPVVADREVQSTKIREHLKQSGKKCMELLQAFYYEQLNMMQLANRFGYKSERSATVQKYKCLEKVRDEVKQKSLNYEDFLN